MGLFLHNDVLMFMAVFEPVAYVGHLRHGVKKPFSLLQLKPRIRRDQQRGDAVRLQMHQRLPHATENVHHIRHRHLIVVEQVDQSVHDHEMRSDSPDKFQQAVGDRNIQLIARIGARHVGAVKKTVRVDAPDTRQFGEQVRIDPVRAVDEDDAPGMH